jgi:hypothetical protein
VRIAAAGGMTSLLEPDFARLAMFSGFTGVRCRAREQQVVTRRLDDMLEIAAMDLLKIDVQGAKLLLFAGAERLLSDAVAVHTEVSFVNLYRDQPVVRRHRPGPAPARVHSAHLRGDQAMGCRAVIFEGNFRVPENQLLEADAVYSATSDVPTT